MEIKKINDKVEFEVEVQGDYITCGKGCIRNKYNPDTHRMEVIKFTQVAVAH